MATDTQNLTTSSTITDEQFQAIVSFISDALDAGGMNKTADIGQVDPDTVTFPGSNNSEGGYEIRAFDDSLTGTAPVAIKLSYRRGSSAAQFQLGVQIGSGSDGSGNITGEKLSQQNFNLVLSAMTSQPWDICATENSFILCGSYSSSQYRSVISLERTRNASNEITDQGLMLVYKNVTDTFRSFYINYAANSFINETTTAGGCMMPSNQTSGLHGSGDTAVYPYNVFGVGEVLVPPLNLVGGFSSNFSDVTTYTIGVFGQSQTMKAIHTHGIARGGAGANAIMLMKWI
ncbi:MAG: hypothetical protein KF855_03780 [Acidobacteria bacterium]|nr:hypothetical protein [Acidobacteriota bacterium]